MLNKRVDKPSDRKMPADIRNMIEISKKVRIRKASRVAVASAHKQLQGASALHYRGSQVACQVNTGPFALVHEEVRELLDDEAGATKLA